MVPRGLNKLDLFVILFLFASYTFYCGGYIFYSLIMMIIIHLEFTAAETVCSIKWCYIYIYIYIVYNKIG